MNMRTGLQLANDVEIRLPKPKYYRRAETLCKSPFKDASFFI